MELAIPLIRERSVLRSAPSVEVLVDGQEVAFGAGAPIGALVTDTATFVRLVSGRRPDPARYELQGAVTPQHLVLFT